MPLINNKHELALFNEYNRLEYYYLLSRRDTKFKNISGGNVRIVVVSQAKNTGFFLDSFCFLLLVPTLIEQLAINSDYYHTYSYTVIARLQLFGS